MAELETGSTINNGVKTTRVVQPADTFGQQPALGMNDWGVLDPTGGSDLSPSSKITYVQTEADPFAASNTGLPVIVTDTSGKRIGNVWNPTGLGDANVALKTGKATKLYLDTTTGKFSNAPISTMSYKDGKITLNVSDDVKNSDWYKNTYESDTFKSLADLYAYDPTGETEIEVSKDDGTKEKKKINDLLQSFADDLKDSSVKYQGYVDIKGNVSNLTNGKLNLSDDDVTIMMNYQNISRKNYSNTDVVYLPNWAKEYFKDYSSYNADSGTISAEDFYKKFYHLDEELPESAKGIIEDLGGGELSHIDEKVAYQNVGESDKDYAIDLVRLKNTDELTQIVERLSFYGDDMSDAEKAELATEYVKAYSLYQTIEKQSPDSSSWTGFNLAMQSVGTGFADGLTTSGNNIIHFGGQLVATILDGGANIVSAIATPLDWLSQMVKAPATGEQVKDWNRIFNDNYYHLAGDNTMVKEIRNNVEAYGRTLDAREDYFGDLFQGREEDLALSFADAAGAIAIGKMAGYILSQTLVTNPIGSAVGASVELVVGAPGRMAAFMNFTEFAAKMATTATTVETATSWLQVLKIAQGTNGLLGSSALGSVMGFSANILAQGVVDTFLENPSLTDALLAGADFETMAEFQNLVRQNTIWNTIGEFAPLAGKKVIQGIKNTDLGTVVQALFRKGVNRITLRGRKIYEGLAEWMTRNSKNFVVEEGDATFTGKLNPETRMQDLRKGIIEIQEQIKNTKLFTGDTLENAKVIDELIQKRIDLEEVLGTSKRLAIAEQKNTIIKSAGLEKNVEELSITTAKLSKLAKTAGKTNLPGSFSIEFSDYLNDLFNRRLLLNAEKAGKLSAKETEALATLNSRIKSFNQSLPTDIKGEFQQLARQYTRQNYNYYYKLNNYLASDAGGNLINKQTLTTWRLDPRYGGDGKTFMPLYAVSGFKNAEDLEAMFTDPSRIIRQGQAKAGVETKARKLFNPDTTYLDPNYTRELYTRAYAQAAYASKMADAVNAVGKTTAVPTDQYGNILKTNKAITQAKRKLYQDLKQSFESSFRENLQSLGQKTSQTQEKALKHYRRRLEAQAEAIRARILGLDESGLKSYAQNIGSTNITRLGGQFEMPEYSRKIRTRADLDAMYEGLSDSQKAIVNNTLDGQNLTVARWNSMVTNNNLDTLLARKYIAESPEILNSDYYRTMVATSRARSVKGDEALALREANATLKSTDEAVRAKMEEDFTKTVQGTLTEAVEGTVASLYDNPYLEKLVKEYEKAGISAEDAKEYIVWQWLYDNRGKSEVVQQIAFNYYNAPSKVSELKISTDTAKEYSKRFQAGADSIIESKLNKTVANINAKGTGGEALDLASTAKRVDGYFKDIAEDWGARRIVETWDKTKGQFKYYKVDSSTYNLITNYPTFVKNPKWARVLARINSIARFGQITIRTASLVTQGFKDTFNAIVLGGWNELLLDNPTAYRKLAEYIGPEVVEAFQKEMTPEVWKDFLKAASKEGLTVEEAIAKAEIGNELLDLKIKKGPGTSTSYYSYRSLYGDADEAMVGAATQVEVAADTWKGATKEKWQNAYKKASEAWYQQKQFGKNIGNKIQDYANILHDAREEFLRKQVYRQNFKNALQEGKSLAQARNYADYFMRNATTDFSRGFAWGSNLIRAIPYFGAAINGASSMIRLLEIDPLGVMIRFNMNLVVPVVGLTVMSLSDPTNAEIYKNIPEYEKEGNMHWVMNGQVYTIPLPEELAKFILPIRHTVESIAGANDNAWGELLLNDTLNLPTIPLNAVMMLDSKKLAGDITVMDRISALGMDLFNQLAPNAARTTYIAMTGKDPYTGEDYGRVKWYEDENGEYQYMTESEYGFANDMAELFKSWGWDTSAIMAEAIFSSIFGAGSLDLAEGIRDFAAAAQQGEFDLSKLLAPGVERAGNVLTGTTRTAEEQANIAWYALVNDIKAEKSELLSSNGKLAKYAQDIDTAKDATTLSQKKQLYASEVKNWQNSVSDRVKQYTAKYGDFYNRSKFAATISMMTTQLSIDNVRNSDQYYNARSLAIKTMYDAGFTSPSDNSVFGYSYRDTNTGKLTIKYTDPIVLSMTKNLLWYQTDEAIEQITDLIELGGLKTKYNNEIYPAYNKYMSASNYNAANDLAAKWDVEFMKALKPIIDNYTVGELLDKNDVIDILDNYILIPNTSEAIGKGKYYSSKTGLNKRRGFAKAYAKKIYEAMKESK